MVGPALAPIPLRNIDIRCRFVKYRMSGQARLFKTLYLATTSPVFVLYFYKTVDHYLGEKTAARVAGNLERANEGSQTRQYAIALRLMQGLNFHPVGPHT